VLDFSSSDPAYRNKNEQFFARLTAAPINTSVIYWADENEYHDVLGLSGELKFEAIPSPVFCQVVGLPNEGYFEAIRSFLGGWFRFISRTRDEWSQLDENNLMA
jgi:hypothetical protein